MSIMIDLPPQVAKEAQGYATVVGTTVERMLIDVLVAELRRHRETSVGRARKSIEVREYLMKQDGWLPNDYVFNRDEANAR